MATSTGGVTKNKEQKTIKRTTRSKKSTAVEMVARKDVSDVLIPSACEIAQRAYEYWELEGCPEGRNIEHWLRAEQDLCEEMKASKLIIEIERSDEM